MNKQPTSNNQPPTNTQNPTSNIDRLRVDGWLFVGRSMRRPGFTLIELLVAVSLMVILMGSVALIFFKSSETVSIQDARNRIYITARSGLDQLERDLAGCLSFSTGNQRLWIRDNAFPNSDPSPQRHYRTAADVISFRSTTLIGGSIRTAQIRYIIEPETDPATGTPKTTRRTNRTLYVLKREVTDLVTAAGADPVPNANALVPTAVPPATSTFSCAGKPLLDDLGAAIPPSELVQYVVSFNIEYLADNLQFSQIGTGAAEYFPPTDPLGWFSGAADRNDPQPAPSVFTGFRLPALRVTLRVIEDVEERQERVISREMKIPMG